MRLGCLFSQSGNVEFLHKAQSPYSVNTLATLAAHAAIQDKTYIEKYVTEVLAARELLYVGLEKLGIPYYESKANFVLFEAGNRSIPPHIEARLAAGTKQPTLTLRETEVLELLAKGMRNKEISGTLLISETMQGLVRGRVTDGSAVAGLEEPTCGVGGTGTT